MNEQEENEGCESEEVEGASGLIAAKQIQQRVGDEAVVAAQSFAEVGGQLEVIHSHTWIPIHWPHQAAASPSATLTTMLATAGQIWRSSASRWVSSIQVENVV